MTTYKPRTYGWVPSFPDNRDYNFPSPPKLQIFPPKLSLKKDMPKVYDQGSLGSCTANATAAAFSYSMKLHKIRSYKGSRLFIYYYARAMRGWEGFDSGAMIRDAVAVLKTNGVSTEHYWKYDISKFRSLPDDKAHKSAAQKNHAVVQYRAVNRDLNSFKSALNQKLPVIIGFTVYDSFEYGTWKEIMPMPIPNERVVGGHAVLICGYDDRKEAFLVRNSWGAGWKMQGYFYMPYAYILNANLSSDFWVVENVGTLNA